MSTPTQPRHEPVTSLQAGAILDIEGQIFRVSNHGQKMMMLEKMPDSYLQGHELRQTIAKQQDMNKKLLDQLLIFRSILTCLAKSQKQIVIPLKDLSELKPNESFDLQKNDIGALITYIPPAE